MEMLPELMEGIEICDRDGRGKGWMKLLDRNDECGKELLHLTVL